MTDPGLENFQTYFMCNEERLGCVCKEVERVFNDLKIINDSFCEARNRTNVSVNIDNLSVFYSCDDDSAIKFKSEIVVFIVGDPSNTEFSLLRNNVLKRISRKTILFTFLINSLSNAKIIVPKTKEALITISNITDIPSFVNDICVNIMFGRITSFEWDDLIQFFCVKRFYLRVYEYESRINIDDFNHFIDDIKLTSLNSKYIFANIVYANIKSINLEDQNNLLFKISEMLIKTGELFFTDSFISNKFINSRITLLCSID